MVAKLNKYEIIEKIGGPLIITTCFIILLIPSIVIGTTFVLSQSQIVVNIIALIMLPLTGLLILFAATHLNGPRKIKRFTITNDLIRIRIPYRIHFQVNWSDFNTIEIIKSKDMDPISDSDTFYFDFIFKGEDFIRSFEIECENEFSSKSLNEIRKKLQEFCTSKNIPFIYQN